MNLTEQEKSVVSWYNQNAEIWASQRKKISEPSFWVQEYHDFQLLRKPQGKILEIGSGSGREATEWVQMGYEYTGIDTSKNLIQIAEKAEPAGQYFHTSVYQMPFLPHTFDAFSSWAMLPHIPKERIKIVLRLIREVLKTEGLGFIAMREGEKEEQEGEKGRWFSYYFQDEFEKILNECNFEIIQKGRKSSRPNLVWLTFFVRPCK